MWRALVGACPFIPAELFGIPATQAPRQCQLLGHAAYPAQLDPWWVTAKALPIAVPMLGRAASRHKGLSSVPQGWRCAWRLGACGRTA